MDFCGFLIISFQNILSYFGLFTKKKEPGLVWRIFSQWFFHKNAPYLILYQWTKFQCHNFSPSQDMEQNVLLTSNLTVDDIINFKICNSKTIIDREKNRVRWKYNNISRMVKAF